MPARGLCTALIVLLGLSAGFAVLIAVLNWFPGLLLTLAMYEAVSWISVGLLVVTGTTFVAWMSQARIGSEAITSKHQHRFTNMWVFVGWILPFGNFYIPYAVMQDIWRASDRSDPMTGLQQRPKSRLVTAWWICFILSNLIVALPGLNGQDLAVVATISALLGIAAAVLAARMIRQLYDMQVTEPSASPAPAA